MLGYTHYFSGLQATADIIADARKIVAASDVTICGPSGEGVPVMTEAEGIRLNGSRAAGESYETFHVQGTKELDVPGLGEACKTDGRPYDEVVTAILIAAAVRSMESRAGVFTTDGRWDNWSAGVRLYERAVRALTEEEKLALELDVARMRPGTLYD
ncbi:hypothetical protein [Arthrobacter sp. SD76]|uniref:hypothetical protein n=1 Tax=Arthrobacter sp. SD76 TaxID=3415007 RepID=UPI003C76E210